VTRWRSPRQRRDAARRRKCATQVAELRAWLAEQEALREHTVAERLAEEFGVDVREVPSRHGGAVEAVGDRWRIVGPLDEVRAELEHRCRRLAMV
jgi:hypothetical protein